MGDVIARDFIGGYHILEDVRSKSCYKGNNFVGLAQPCRRSRCWRGIKGFVPPWPIRHGSGKVTDCTEERSIVWAPSNNYYHSAYSPAHISLKFDDANFNVSCSEGRRFSHGAEGS